MRRRFGQQLINDAVKELAHHLLQHAILIDGGQLVVPLSAFDTVPNNEKVLARRVALKRAQKNAILSSDINIGIYESQASEIEIPVNRWFLEKHADQHFCADKFGRNVRLTNEANLAFRILSAARESCSRDHVPGLPIKYFADQFPGTPQELETAKEKSWIYKSRVDLDGPLEDVFKQGSQSELEKAAGVTHRQIGLAIRFDKESAEANLSGMQSPSRKWHR